MHARVYTFSSALLVALSIAASACDDNNNHNNGTRLQVGARFQTIMTGPSPIEARVLLSVEPSTVVPEFLTGTTCPTLPAFRTRFTLFFPIERDLFLRGLRFQFVDRLGVRTVPSTGPVPIPTPGSLPFHGATAPSNRLDLLLSFACGVRAVGTLMIEVETADRSGAIDVSHLSVRITG